MQLSVLLPTHRTGLGAISRIAQACSWAGPDIEVLVRDNSGNAEKRELISRFQGDHCQIVMVDPCEPLENFFELLRLAKGEFIFCPADDDLCSDRAIEALPGILHQVAGDPSVAGVTGQYLVEAPHKSEFFSYAGVGSDDVAARVTGYLNNRVANTLLYSVVRRSVVERVISFMQGMPIFLSFHDQIQCLLYLLGGKFIQLPRLLYIYDLGVWGARETAQQRDVDFYKAAGLDPAINVLHWFLCAFEGAVLIRNSAVFSEHPLTQRQSIADLWFSAMFDRFVTSSRSTIGSKFEDEAQKVRSKLLASIGQLSFQGLLADICNLMALFAPDKAHRYFEFWSAQINQRVSPAHRVEAPASRAAG